MIDYLLDSLPKVHLYILGPGLAICAFLALKAFSNFFTLKWIKAATSLVYILIVLLFMAKYGNKIAEFLELDKPASATNEQTTEPSSN